MVARDIPLVSTYIHRQQDGNGVVVDVHLYKTVWLPGR